MTLNMLGAYGDWAAASLPDPPRLSFRQPIFQNVESWRPVARARYRELLLGPAASPPPIAVVQHRLEFDGLAIEHLHWQLPYGPPTEALILKPAKATGKLPGVVALHDHGGNKYFGLRKITRMSKDPHPLMIQHQNHYYGGLAWANELARRGYVVLVHDTFTFGSRRMRLADLPGKIRNNLVEENPESPEEIQKYNQFAGAHEHLIAKSLFSAGMTWPGVFVSDDQRALDYLASRPDVDATRLGCAGLSGGGLRTVMLTGADERIRCSCCAGMMTTWADYVLQKSYTHTWMCYVPGLPKELDYPEILGLGAPNPILVLNNRQDELFTLSEMEHADRILREVYRKAGASDHYKANFYDGPHKFDAPMQKDAFAWFDRWLKG
ncbi:dienelactone hydrolase family protein [Bryobacter aggregatus]|uniref:dienelactone hydrolase family protein n=1 Tax=Bryobacter aggregatus TaxID=360054 RepID=UPI0004E1FF71|nr:prolyl oligopeptidase family serine peptidase [Bryobacter aggregatus]